jgi:hypothetical protein
MIGIGHPRPAIAAGPSLIRNGSTLIAAAIANKTPPIPSPNPARVTGGRPWVCDAADAQ